MTEELKVDDKVAFPDGETGTVIAQLPGGRKVVVSMAAEPEFAGWKEMFVMTSLGEIHGVKVCERYIPEPDYTSWKPGTPIRMWNGKRSKRVMEGIFLAYKAENGYPLVCAEKLNDGSWSVNTYEHAELIQEDGK